MPPRTLHIGTAGWTIPLPHAASAPLPGTHLERYARVLACAEINSSFYRSHRATTWHRWAASTPEGFQFSVKCPKAITHTARLVIEPSTLGPFFQEIAALGDKLGPILIQLPPSLRFDDCPAAEFFEAVRERHAGPIALEPRHPTWFTPAANDLLIQHRISRVAADPHRDPQADPSVPPTPGGDPALAYFRLHGSPRAYYSSYDQTYLAALARLIEDLPSTTDLWVTFDNTAAGHAFANAVVLQKLVARRVKMKKKRDKPSPLAG